MHFFMCNVDFISHFAFCNYWKWPLRFNLSNTFKMATNWDSWSFVKAQMKLRVRKYSKVGAGSWSPEKMISRSIVVCFRDSFSHFFTKMSLDMHDFFLNQGAGLLTFKIKESERKSRRAKKTTVQIMHLFI